VEGVGAVDVALRRLREYAERTGVRFEPGPRRAGWQELGLPDMRGFTPHLRTVRRFAGEPAEFPRSAEVAAGTVGFDELETRELWLLHDLAHVIWYDFATIAFEGLPPGVERWRDRDFFVEHHLASEAFAVLLLDYHVLSRTQHHGLAVELDAAAWEELRKSVRELPQLDSWRMCRALLAQYHTGAEPLFQDPLRGGALGERRGEATAAALARWRDHEASYSDKQRAYVLLWWNDLVGASAEEWGSERAVVEGSALAEPLWHLLRLFTTEPEAAFRAHVERASRRLRGVDDHLARLPKRRGERETWDFRFTDATAVEPGDVAETLRRASAPRASELFLFWQLLALSAPERLSPGERNAVTLLAKSAQSPKPSPEAWTMVRSLCERIVVEERWLPDPRRRAAFFLP
jgi:hypothetical protein